MQQHPVARYQPHLLDQNPRHPARDGVDAGPGKRVIEIDQGTAVGPCGGSRTAQQLNGGIQAVGIGQFGQVEDKVGLLVCGRQVVENEPVKVGAGPHQLPPPIPARTCRAMTIFCTSEAPS